MKKNKLIFVLMVSSLLLLLAFQVLWIVNAYENAFFNFRRDTNLLLRNTITNMRLATIVKNMVEVKHDSANMSSEVDGVASRMMVYDVDTLKLKRRSKHLAETRKNVQIFIESGEAKKEFNGTVLNIKDSLKSLHRDEPTFVIKLRSDSLPLDSIRKHYQAALVQAKIDAGFEILHFKPDAPIDDPMRTPATEFLMGSEKEFAFAPEGETRKRKFNIYSDTIHSEAVRFSPFQLYGAKLFNVRAILFREITPQILFSVFLSFMIAAAFIVMYRSLRAQQKLMEIKNDFISNVTHELKTPVATVSVALEALKNFNALDNRQRTAEYLEIAQNELKRLTLMTDKILKTSVFETKGVDMTFVDVELDEIAEQVISSMKLLLETRKIKLDYSKYGSSFQLKGAEEHLTNVLYNLVDNAIKYSRDDSTISVNLSSDENTIKLEVVDQGVGISKEYHGKVFEKFFRVPSGDLHNIKGYGLGLSYVSGVVSNHRGLITLDSEPGKGSTFTVTLPRNHVS